MPRVTSVIPRPTVGPPFREADLRTTCVECCAAQSLDEAIVDERDPMTTVYNCREGCATPILLVTPPVDEADTKNGYRFSAWMMRNPSDVLVHRPDHTAVSLIFPASPRALERGLIVSAR